MSPIVGNGLTGESSPRGIPCGMRPRLKGSKIQPTQTEPCFKSIGEPRLPLSAALQKGNSVFSEREALLKCTERFGPNLVAATSPGQRSHC